MKKNSQIHVFIETNVLKSLKKQTEDEEKTFSKLCRERLVGGSKLPIIEYKLDRLISILANKGTTAHPCDKNLKILLYLFPCDKHMKA